MMPYAVDSHYYGYAVDEQKNAIEQRRRVHRLFYVEGCSKNEIARTLGLSKAFVMRWTESPTQDLTADARGWPKGQGRRWDEAVRERVAQVHAALVADPKEFFTGATAVQLRYRQRYPRSPVPPLRTIGRLLKELGLSAPRKTPRTQGAARYLCYPEHTVYHTLGRRALEVDFIGRKFLTGRSAPVNFLGFRFKLTPRLRYFYRVKGETGEALIEACEDFFARFETPDVVKVDNGPAAIGSGSGKRSLSRFVRFLLQHQVLPVFAVPRKPFSQASIEGNNSVFSRKFWNPHTFSSLKDIDRRLAWFNRCSLSYTGYTAPASKPKTRRAFVPRVYFIRQVREHPERPQHGSIDVLNELVALPTAYIHYFVLAEWNLQDERLKIYFEQNQKAKCIKSQSFKLNPNSRYKPV